MTPRLGERFVCNWGGGAGKAGKARKRNDLFVWQVMDWILGLTYRGLCNGGAAEKRGDLLQKGKCVGRYLLGAEGQDT